MKLNVDIAPLLDGSADSVSFELDCPLDDCAEDEQASALCGDMFSDVSFDGPLHLSGKIVNHSGYMSLGMTLSADYDTECARCLKPLRFHACYSAEKGVACRGTLQNEDTEDYLIAEGAQLDVVPAAEEILLLELPQKHLCSDDCKGLCPKCGRNLNEGDCGCVVSEPDPRLAVLKTLLGKE